MSKPARSQARNDNATADADVRPLTLWEAMASGRSAASEAPTTCTGPPHGKALPPARVRGAAF
eukprot:338807-Chlamydomonas_euryale.AAC.1